MALIDRIEGLLAKIESTPGTDAVPVAASNTIQTVNLQINPYESESVNRGTDRPTLGGETDLITKRRTRYQFGVHMAGSGTATTEVKYAPLLRACGYGAGVVGLADVQYSLISSSIPTLTIHGHKDGQKHPSVYCRGELGIQMAVGQLPLFLFDFGGLYVTPTSAADPSFDYTGWGTSRPLGNDATPTASLHGTDIEMISLALQLNNQIEHVDTVNFEGIELVQRNVQGTIVFRAPAISAKDWFTAIDNETLGALQVVHGTVSGSIVQLDAPNVQLTGLDYAESQGFVTISAGIRCIPSGSGNNELKITTK